MDEFVYVDGKKYRRGYTSGSCACGATKAALIMHLEKRNINEVRIGTPKGVDLDLKIDNISRGKDWVQCSVKKDGGDDIDATHGMDIFARLELIQADQVPDFRSDLDSDYLFITSGQGIGRVTKKGLDIRPGRPAINRVPLNMILKVVQEILDEAGLDIYDYLGGRKILVTIFAPQGQEIAKRTFNSNLGIEGGISIIGTTGIVDPMSDEGWKKALSAELAIKRAEGRETIILVPGNIGRDIMAKSYGADLDGIVKMSNFIGYMLMETKRLGFKRVIVGGHIGKLIKLSGGITNSHSRVADARREIMVANLALLGAPLELLKEVDACLSTDAMVDIIRKAGYSQVFKVLADKAASKAKVYMRLGQEDHIDIEVYLFSMDGSLLAKSQV
ncbi:cobalt-precorrin-5B (C(1))-methyltransferase CbiD [Peptostreptococcus stomatis]|uniref:cobalt-precorrin-5B (C(1))-methyltransferase CbiD n=1 Tax=Peptostreptococcus stomatis TaxID=341694 RepID=UPI0028D66620|nr:cobalt-precorrin-5B (C(1))-methyltransferase CbiD [Peptostreptococcus stomatis]